MSPIIELQRRMVEAGRIRAGDKQSYTDDKGETKYRANKLDKWRLTSKDRQRLDAAADLWGGTAQPWEGHAGEFELYTDTDALPIMLLPGQLPSTWYELWSKGGCQRRCDGVHEMISDSACLCGDERECKPHTRLSVLLPDLPGIGSWLLSSTGWNAASELGGAADLLQRASAQGVLMPARLRLEQRVEVKSGQTRRFAVPVIDVDVSFRDLMQAQGALSSPSEQRALPQGYVPITRESNGTTLAEGLEAAEAQTLQRTSRSAAPIPAADDDIPFDNEPVSVLAEDAAPSGNTISQSTREKPLTQAQAKKLDVLVGRLRDAGHIKTVHLYAALSESRNVDVDTMAKLLGQPGEDGEIHWTPLRDSLVRHEAHALIDRLEGLESKVVAA